MERLCRADLLAVWEHVQAIFSLAGKIEGDMSTCLWYEEREKGCQVNNVYGERKVQLS